MKKTRCHFENRPTGQTRLTPVRVVLGIVFMMLISCKADRIVVPSAVKAPHARASLTSPPGLKGFISADFTFETARGRKHYRSQKLPFNAVASGGGVQIPAEAIDALAASTTEIPAVGQIAPESFFASAHSIAGVNLASVVAGPEATLYAFAAANPVASQPNDLYLADSDYRMLTGASYSEDIGNGTIAQIVIDPITSRNPNGLIHLYLGGRQVVTVNPQYQPYSPGEYKYNTNQALYSYQTGAQISSGYLSTPMQQTPTSWDPAQRELERQVYRNTPRLARLIDTFLPATAYAQTPQPCNTFIRGALIGLAGMLWAGVTENPIGFIISFVGVVNQTHGYARCKENEAAGGGIKNNPPKTQ